MKAPARPVSVKNERRQLSSRFLRFEHSSVHLLRNRTVLWNVSRNELRARYAGSLLGVAWTMLAPLSLLAIYATVYIVILRVSIPSLGPVQYAIFIFAGLVPFMMNAEALSAGVSSVLANASVLNNTVFPIDLVPVKAVLLSQAVMVAGMSVVLVGALTAGLLSWTAILLPVIWILHVIALVGLSWCLSLLTIVVRDMSYAVTLLIAALYVLSPIAYTREMVPPALAPLIWLNPLAYYIMSYQDVLVRGRIPAFAQIIAMLAISSVLFGLGGWFFSRAKRVMVDYL